MVTLLTRLIEITVKHTDKKSCRETAEHLTDLLKVSLPGVKILGPGEPMISKIRNQFLMSILIKVIRGKGDLAGLKNKIQEITNNLVRKTEYRKSKIVLDVDPV